MTGLSSSNPGSKKKSRLGGSCGTFSLYIYLVPATKYSEGVHKPMEQSDQKSGLGLDEGKLRYILHVGESVVMVIKQNGHLGYYMLHEAQNG